MRICILGQEEPVYFGPFLRGIIQARPEEIAGIVIAGKRGAGDHASTAREKALNVLTLWLLIEPSGFARNAFISLWQALIMKAGLTGSWLDKRSFEGAALGRRIPVIRTCNINSEETRRKISDIAPDIIINRLSPCFTPFVFQTASAHLVAQTPCATQPHTQFYSRIPACHVVSLGDAVIPLAIGSRREYNRLVLTKSSGEGGRDMAEEQDGATIADLERGLRYVHAMLSINKHVGQEGASYA